MVGLVLCGVGIRRVRGSTLTAPILWAAISWLALLAGEGLARPATESAALSWRYLAGVSTFCPAMALLGAKRPQDRGWQWIVASLWLILCVPVIQLVVLTPSGTLELHPAWRGLMVLLILVGITNHLPTRFGWASLLFGIAQWLLLNGPPPSLNETLLSQNRLALGLILLSGLGVWMQVRYWPRNQKSGWNRVWLDFRDAFGSVWALRVAERMNQAARQAETPLHLYWHGFEHERSRDERLAESLSANTIEPFDGAELGELEVTARQLLRRFVSAEWIERRLHAG